MKKLQLIPVNFDKTMAIEILLKIYFEKDLTRGFQKISSLRKSHIKNFSRLNNCI